MQAKQAGKPRLLQALFDAFSLPDLRRRILITLGILVAFRFIAHIPLPGIDQTALAALFESNQILGMLDLFSGGAMRNMSVAALGVYPYITASIIMTLMVPIIPRLQALSQEGEAGRSKINMITHFAILPLAGMQGYSQLVLLQNAEALPANVPALTLVTMVLSMIAGTMFLVWMGELITKYGIGNGISIIIFGGIIAGYPQMLGRAGINFSTNPGGVIFYFVLAILTVAVIVIFTEAHRRIPVQYSKNVFRGGRMYRQGGSTHVPIRVNSAGMIPLIFAMAVVLFPGVVASYFQGPATDPNFANTLVEIFNPSTALPLGIVYWALYFLLVIGFAFFYTTVMFQQQDLPGVLQRQGGFIPGIRPGKNTSTYLNNVTKHITRAGALFLAMVAIMPFISRLLTGVDLALSSMGLLIMVGVTLDTMKQLESQLLMRRYEGFIK